MHACVFAAFPAVPCALLLEPLQDELALHLAAGASRWSKSADAVQALLSAAPQPGGAAAAAAATDGHGRVALVRQGGEHAGLFLAWC